MYCLLGLIGHRQVMADRWCPSGTEPFDAWKARTDTKMQWKKGQQKKKEGRTAATATPSVVVTFHTDHQCILSFCMDQRACYDG